MFSNKENRVVPTNSLFKPTKNKISEDMTKEVIMEKFGDDFDVSGIKDFRHMFSSCTSLMLDNNICFKESLC